MPHIEIRYNTETISFDAQSLAQDLHEQLAQEDGITKAQIKTSAVPLSAANVGEFGHKNMIHITLKIWDAPERTNAIVKPWLERLAIVAEKHIPKNSHCALSVELVRIDRDIYISKYFTP